MRRIFEIPDLDVDADPTGFRFHTDDWDSTAVLDFDEATTLAHAILAHVQQEQDKRAAEKARAEWEADEALRIYGEMRVGIKRMMGTHKADKDKP